ncbi:MAG: hypothetical protein L0H84_06900 [Pseudonocardia sp.]|nr:hypothetical protein [Pseudonocardia sp.]
MNDPSDSARPGERSQEPESGAPEPAPQDWAPPRTASSDGGPAGHHQPPHGGPPYGPPGPQGHWRPDVPLRPGVIPLRPLGLGEILDGAISFIRSNPLVTIGLSAGVVAIAQLIQVLVGLATGAGVLPNAEDAVRDPERYLQDLSNYLGSTVIAGFVSFIAVSMLTGLLIVVLSQAVLGRRMTAGEAWRATRGRLPGLIGITMLAAIGVALPIAVLLLPALLAAGAGAGGGIVALLFIPGLLAGLAATIYLWVSWSLIGPIYVLEHAGAIAAFRRSRRLVTPQWWRIFGILVLAVIIATIIGGIIAVPFSFAAIAVSESPTVLSIGAQVLIGIGAVLAGMLTTPFQAGVTGLVYFDQRIRREGLDITLQRAAGR